MSRRDLIDKDRDEITNDSYTRLAVRWAQTTPNILTKKPIERRDMRLLDGNIHVPMIGFVIYVQTAYVHNVASCFLPDYAKRRPCAVLIFDDGEIVDVWYFIRGKKPYSLAHKHSFDPAEKIVAKCPRTDVEYEYFERAMLAIDKL